MSDTLQHKDLLEEERHKSEFKPQQAEEQKSSEAMRAIQATQQALLLAQSASLSQESSDAGVQADSQALVQAPQHTSKVSIVQRIYGGLPLYLPKNSAEALPDYSFYDKKISGLGKVSWYKSGKTEYKPERMSRHIERFLSSSEITDENVFNVSKTVIDEYDVFSYITKKEADVSSMQDFSGKNVQTADALLILKNLKEAGASDATFVDSLLSNRPELFGEAEKGDLPLDSDYYRQYPAAAKILMMYRLAKNIDPSVITINGKANKELTARFNGMVQNLAPLAESIRQSVDYQHFMSFSQRKSQEKPLSEHGEVMAKRLSHRMKMLDVAVSEWHNFLKVTDIYNIPEIMDNIFYLLKAYENDINQFISDPGDSDYEFLSRITTYSTWLYKLRVYYREGTPDDIKEQIETELGFERQAGHEELDRFDEEMDEELDAVKEEWGQAIRAKEVPGVKEETDEELKKVYPPLVIDSVRNIDKWVASRVMRTADGDSEANFSAYILRKPFAQRLAMYYLIENEKLDNPSAVDIVVSQNDYVPDYAKFKKQMKASKIKVHAHLASFAKSKNVVRKSKTVSRMLGELGDIYLTKLEAAVRLLEDDTSGFGAQVDAFEAMKARNADDSVGTAEERERFDKFVAFMKAINSHQQLLGKTLATKEDIDESAEALRAAYENLVEADKLVAEYYQEEGLKQKATDRSGQSQTIDTVAGLASTGVGIVSTIDQKLTDFSSDRFSLGIWNLGDTDISNTIEAAGWLYGIQGVAALGSAVASIATAVQRWNEGDGTLKADLATSVITHLGEVGRIGVMTGEILSNHGEILTTVTENVAEGALKAGIGTTVSAMNSVMIAGMVGGGVKTIEGVVNVISAGINDANHEIATEEALEQLEILERAEKQRQRQESQESEQRQVSEERQEIQERQESREGEEQEDERRKTAIDLRRKRMAVERVRKITSASADRKIEQGVYKGISGTLTLIGAGIPAISIVTMALSGTITAVATIRQFYTKMNERDSAIDSFIGMDGILGKFKQTVSEQNRLQILKNKFGEGDVAGFTEEEKDLKYRDILRQLVLKKMKISSYEAMFAEAAKQYVEVIYNAIFYRDNGELIYDGDSESIPPEEGHQENKLRFALMGTFAPLKFKFPPRDGDKKGVIKPTKQQMLNSLSS